MIKRISIYFLFFVTIFLSVFPAHSNECDHLGAFDQNSCTQVWNQWSHCGDHVWIYAEAMPQKKIYTRWNENCEISLSEFESRFVSCRIDLLRRCHAVFQDGGEEGAGEWTSAGTSSYSQNSHITWNNIEEPLTYGFLTLETVLYDFQNSPTAPRNIQAHQTLVTHFQLEQGRQQIENQIFEIKKQNEAFETHLENVKQEYKELRNEVEVELNKYQENSLESLRQRFREEKKLFKDYLDKLQLENNTPIHVSDHVSETPIASDAQEFTTKLASLYENKNLEELIRVLHETEIELSYLRSQKLPQPVAQYLSLRESVLSQYLNTDGIITFLLDTPEFFPIGTLQSDKNTPEGQEIRYQINRGIVAHHLIQSQPTEHDRVSLAMAFLGGADQAASQEEIALAHSLLNTGKILIDIALGLIPVVGEIYDVSNIIKGILTGHDLLGNPMDGWDYVLNTFSVMVPFLSASHLKLAKQGFKLRETLVHNPLPKSGRFSRVISEDVYKQYIDMPRNSLQKQGSRAFITATDDLENIQKHEDIIKRLGFDGSSPRYKELQNSPLYELEIIPKNEKAIEQFGLRTPIVSDYDNFIGRGLTSGGAREWDMKNMDFIQDARTGEKLLFPEGYIRKHLNEPLNPQDALGTLRVKRMINKP